MKRCIVIAAIMLAGCGGMDADGDEFTAAELTGGCPDSWAVGVPTELDVRVLNTSDTNWPVLFMSFLGLPSFKVESATLAGAPGERADTPATVTYGFDAGLEAGEARRVRIELVPIAAAETFLRFGAWGGEHGDPVPGGIDFVGCPDIEIQP